MDQKQNELFKYFVEQTNVKLEKMDKKLDDLFVFKWKVVGASMLASASLSIVIEAAIVFFHSRSA